MPQSKHLQNLKNVALPQKWSRDPDHVPFRGAGVTLEVGLAVIDRLAKFKQYSLTHSRNIEGGLKFRKWSHVPDHGRFGRKFFTPVVGLTVHLPNLKSIASSISKILMGVYNFKRVTWPFWGEIFAPGMGLAVVDPTAKFSEHSFIYSRNIWKDIRLQSSCQVLQFPLPRQRF